jgi:hypothetical protein
VIGRLFWVTKFQISLGDLPDRYSKSPTTIAWVLWPMGALLAWSKSMTADLRL